MRIPNFLGFLVFFGILLSDPAMAQSSSFDGFVVIGNNTGITWFSEEDASSVFRGKISGWANGKPILVVLPNSRNSGASLIARRIFSTDPQGMQRYWLSQVFQGRTNAPVFLETWDDIVKKVREVEGAIAMVPRGTAVPADMIIQVR